MNGFHFGFVLPDHDRGNRADVLGLEDLLVLNGLDSVLVVVDVAFSVDGLHGLGVLLRTDVLLGDFGGYFRANLSVSLAVRQPENFEAHLCRIGLVRRLEEVLNALSDSSHFGYVFCVL